MPIKIADSLPATYNRYELRFLPVKIRRTIMETAYQKVKVHNELEWCQVTDLSNTRAGKYFRYDRIPRHASGYPSLKCTDPQSDANQDCDRDTASSQAIQYAASSQRGA